MHLMDRHGTILIWYDSSTVMVIGWEKAMTSVSESVGVVELCVRIMNIPTEIELPAGIRVILSVITLRGTAGI